MRKNIEMKKVEKAMNKTGILSVITGIWMLAAIAAPAVVRTGEAVVAALVGEMETRVSGNPEIQKLSEGQSVGEACRVMTRKKGRACLVLSPGAILCMAPDTEVTFRQLRHSAAGLPKSEDDLIRRVYIDVHKGRILVHAGAPTPSLDIEVRIDSGVVNANGGTFVVAQTGRKEWALISEEYDISVTPTGGKRAALAEGSAATLKMSESGAGVLEDNPDLMESPLREFEVCNCYFEDLEPFFYDPIHFDRAGLGDYLGAGGDITFVGARDTVFVVSRSSRLIDQNQSLLAPPLGASSAGRRWDPARAWTWYEQMGVLKGVNYIPRNAVNSTDMWLEETFDADLIDEELGWAQKAGYTALRVQLQYVVWKEDPEAFLDRMEEFLDIAEKHDLRVVPVLFDDKNLAGSDPKSGPQPEPVPGKHNARWTPGPGTVAATDRSTWPGLEEYVKDVVGEFKRDDRIAYWDLYNRTGDNDLWEQTLPLMDQAFSWAREVGPDQPLAVAAWTRMESAMSTRMLERSDIVTFQSFDSAGQVEALLLLLNRYERPIICSDWLMRQQDSTFEKLLPLFSVNRVGWFNRGLVQGETQEWIQQEQFRSETEPDLWQHDVLEPDGEAYDADEIKLIQEFRFYNN